jgi:hypothetical protein
MIEYIPITTTENFIGAWYFEDLTVCDEIISHFKLNPNKSLGKQYVPAVKQLSVIPEIKDSIDCVFEKETELFQRYIKNLQCIVHEYIKKFPWCDQYDPWTIAETVNIQYYKPGAGYHGWHTERSTATSPNSSRHLVFMTYLNDVEDSGETEFINQKIKIKPRKGLTLIWPADWTYTHRGITSLTQEKYIVTGWFSFC